MIVVQTGIAVVVAICGTLAACVRVVASVGIVVQAGRRLSSAQWVVRVLLLSVLLGFLINYSSVLGTKYIYLYFS